MQKLHIYTIGTSDILYIHPAVVYTWGTYYVYFLPWFLRTCFCKSYVSKNFSLQASQSIFLTFSCTLSMCLFRWFLYENFFSQVGQVNCLSSLLWTNVMCFWRWFLVKKLLPQMSHLNFLTWSFLFACLLPIWCCSSR